MTNGQPFPVRADRVDGLGETIEVSVTHGDGLHARPAVVFTRLARSFPCVVELDVDGAGQWFNAKSIVKVMGARIRKGSVLAIRAAGPESRQAVNALAALVARDFDEDSDAGRR
jgi:phosphocarrier protein